MYDILLPQSRLERLRNTWRFPAQAAVAARLPLARGRVPMRFWWRTQPVQFTRFASETLTSVSERGKRIAPRARPLLSLWPLIAAAALGALIMYYIDPGRGRRRRALVRDQVVHAGHVVTHDVPHTLEKRGRFFRGVAKGVTHDAAHLVRPNGHAVPDDETLVARVRSEVLRSDHFRAGEINIDAYEGTVTLRGQLEREADIGELVDATGRVEGVRQVRSYLHLPDQLPPNKAEVYEHAARALPSI